MHMFANLVTYIDYIHRRKYTDGRYFKYHGRYFNYYNNITYLHCDVVEKVESEVGYHDGEYKGVEIHRGYEV